MPIVSEEEFMGGAPAPASASPSGKVVGADEFDAMPAGKIVSASDFDNFGADGGPHPGLVRRAKDWFSRTFGGAGEQPPETLGLAPDQEVMREEQARQAGRPSLWERSKGRGLVPTLAAEISPQTFADTVVNAPAGLAASFGSGVNTAAGSLVRGLDEMATFISNKTGLPKGGLFESAAKEYQQNAGYWDKAIQENGVDALTQLMGKAVGGAVPGFAEFALGPVYYGLREGAATGNRGGSPVIGAVKGAGERYLTGSVLEALNMLKMGYRVPGMAALGAAQAAADGGNIPEAAGTMALYGVMGPTGGMGFRDIREGLRPASKTEQAAEARWGKEVGSVKGEVGSEPTAGEGVSGTVVSPDVFEAAPAEVLGTGVRSETLPPTGAAAETAGLREPAAAAPSSVERRAQFADDAVLREKLSALPAEAIHNMVLTDPVSGARSRLAYELLEKDNPAEFTGISDARGLGAVDKWLGHKAGDDFVQKVVAAHKEEGIPVYRASDKGDEFLTRWNGLTKEEADAKLKAVNDRLRNSVLEVTNPDGSKRYFTNLELYTALGRDYNEAGQLLGEQKRANQPAGYVKGEFPRHLVELSQERGLAATRGEGKPAPGPAAAAKEVTPLTEGTKVTPAEVANQAAPARLEPAPSEPPYIPEGVTPPTAPEARPEGQPLSLVEQAKNSFLEKQGAPPVSTEPIKPTGVLGAIQKLREKKGVMNRGAEEKAAEGQVNQNAEKDVLKSGAGPSEKAASVLPEGAEKRPELPTELHAFPGGLGKKAGELLGQGMVKFFDWAGERIRPELKEMVAILARTQTGTTDVHPARKPLYLRNISRAAARNRDSAFILKEDPEAGYAGIKPLLDLKAPGRVRRALGTPDELGELSKIIFRGDIEKARYTPEQLKQRFKASERVVNAYLAARDVVERMEAVDIERSKEIALSPYETDPRLYGKLERVMDDLIQTPDAKEREKYMSRLFHDQSGVLDAQTQTALTRLKEHVEDIHDRLGTFEDNPGYMPREREEGAFHVRALEHVLTQDEAGQVMGAIMYGLKARRFKPYDADTLHDKFGVSGKTAEAYKEAMQKVAEDQVLSRYGATDAEVRKAVGRIVDSVTIKERWMDTATTYSKAKALSREAQDHPEQHFPENYRKGAKYEYKIKENPKLPEGVYADIGNPAAREAVLERAVRDAQRKGSISRQDAEGISDAILRANKELALKRGGGVTRLQRNKDLIEGYKTGDIDNILVGHVTGQVGYLNKALYAIRALRDIEGLGKNNPRDLRWANEYYKNSLKNSTPVDRIVAAAKGYAMFARLGFIVKTAVNNSFQHYMTAIPEFSAYTGSAMKQLERARYDVLYGAMEAQPTKSKWGEAGKKISLALSQDAFKRPVLTEFDKKVINDAVESGAANAQYLREASGTTDRAPGRGLYRSTLEASMKMFGAIEATANRATGYVAAMRLFTGQIDPSTGKPYGLDRDGKPYHLSYDAAMAKADDFIRHSHYEISRANEPELISKVGAPLRGLYTFQSFTADYLNRVFNLAREGNTRVLGRYILATWVLGGLAAAPFSDEIDAILSKQFGFSVKMKLRFMIRHFLNQTGADGETKNTLEDLVMNGIPAAAAGADMSRSVQINTPLPLSLILDTDNSMGEKASGAIGGLAVSAGRALGATASGDWWRAGENISPNAVGNIMRAYRMYSEGATTGSGKAIFDEQGNQIQYTAAEAVKRSLGFMPMRVSRYNELSQQQRDLGQYWGDERQNILNGFRKSGGDTKWVDAADKFNERVLNDPTAFGVAPLITGKSLRNAMANKPEKKSMMWQQENLSGEGE